MDESSAVQAPVTRLRRRLSVEQSEDQNSPGPSTPTKKRGRLAAKPQLELIDENAGSTSKRSTKKAPIKEIAEASEDKPVTPARRSTRIKSNTSIISETTQTVDSPRAKRAARRTSQIGSDNESVVTPPLRTYGRRTRKDSTSSIDKLDTDAKPTITVIIVEENEVDCQKSNISPTKSENGPVRKSPRLQEKKKDNVRKSNDNAMEETDSMNNDTINDLNIIKQDDIPASTETKTVTTEAKVTVPEKSPDTFSDTSFSIIIDDIIKDLDKKPKSKPSLPNKSMSALDNDNSFKSKRRTNSLNVIFQTQTNDSDFLSDNEKTKKKVKTNNISAVFNTADKEHRFASGDSKLINTSPGKHDKDPISQQQFETSNLSLKESQSDLLANTTVNKENINVKDQVEKDSVINFLKKPPTSVLETTIIYDDSDTDTKIKDVKNNIDSEDQCVPVVETSGNCENSEVIVSPTLNKSTLKNKDENILNNTSVTHNSEIFTINVSCEPMDVDETIPNNTFISETSDINKTAERGDLKSLGEVNKSLNESSNKSKRKSSTSHSTSQNLEKSGTENKSTLILSQIKDVSSSENNPNKSHQEILSKSTTSDTKDKKKADKKNLSLDYSTSTPLGQKHLHINKKFGLQINTSAIETSKTDAKQSTNSPNISKKETSKSKDIATSSDEKSSTDDESSETKSLLDNEASVASDDYESGDSQDDEDRQYEKENEVVEKGETLDLEEDISNDSDYEKDSFLVSSDDADRDLLSGSGDDLSMTDNELTMSAKSKKKYNERKLKEQKKASKEIFEARHNTQNAKKSNKKSRKLESSGDSEESEDEIRAHRKKNRQRLDSTHDDTDTSKVNEESFNKNKKNRSKRLLSDSDANESVSKEPEITTMFNNSAIENDPLSTQVKQEPKTPHKDFNVSTVQINEAIEEVVVENSKSFSKVNQTTDPLHTTMMDDDESSLSENSEIMNNYNSILNQLNNNDAKSKTIKSHDTSLNPITKTKNTKIPIVEELNLTNTKKSKRNNNTDSVDVVDSPNVSKPTGAKVNKYISNKPDEDSSSDSIDLHLLFSEDSSNISINQKEKEDDDFIPLKRTPAKTNILNQDEEQSTTNEIRFIVDTEGTRANANDSINISLNSNTKKTNKKHKSLNISQLPAADDTNSGDEDAPLEMPFTKEEPDENSQSNDVPDISSAGSAKKKKKHSIPLAEQSDVPAEPTVSAPDSAKKSKKKRVSESQAQEDTPAEPTIPVPESVKKHKKKRVSESQEQDTPAEPTIPVPDSVKKHKKKRVSESQEPDTPAEPTIPAPDSVKKHKKKRVSESQEQDTPAEPTIPAPDSMKKSKKKRVSESQEQDTPAEPTIPALENDKKSKKKRVSESQEPDTPAEPTMPAPDSVQKSKKKRVSNSHEQKDTPAESKVPESDSAKKSKKKLVSQSQELLIEDVTAEPTIPAPNSAMKSKKKLISESHDQEDPADTSLVVPVSSKKKKNKSLVEQTDSKEADISLVIPGSGKKKKHMAETELEESGNKLNVSQNAALDSTKKQKRKMTENIYSHKDSEDLPTQVPSNSKKRKRKSSVDHNLRTDVEGENDVAQTANMSLSAGRQNKKRKVSQNEIDETNEEETQRKEKIRKKRKRDVDDDNNVSKKLKESSFDKVNVPRLPASILNQLEDKPKEEILAMKKSAVISTTPFVVEEAKKRKSKPSNYLEESVYLNDSQDIERKLKGHIKKPKVLPFVPTATTSGSGFTTTFKIKTIPQEVKFVAQTKNVTNFKTDYLYGNKIKRQGTYEMYKKHRTYKLSKF